MFGDCRSFETRVGFSGKFYLPNTYFLFDYLFSNHSISVYLTYKNRNKLLRNFRILKKDLRSGDTITYLIGEREEGISKK